MLNYLLKSFLSRFFKLEYNITIDDPYYELVPTNNQKTHFKKVPKRLPDNLSSNDEKILKKIKTRAYRYDMAFSFIGVPFGTQTIFQLIPVVGSIYTTWNSFKILLLTRQLTNGFPLDLFLFCLLNVIVDLLLSLIPIVGDIINISDYNNGLISKDSIRPNFLNRKFGWFKENGPIEVKLLAAKDVLKKSASTTLTSMKTAKAKSVNSKIKDLGSSSSASSSVETKVDS